MFSPFVKDLREPSDLWIHGCETPNIFPARCSDVPRMETMDSNEEWLREVPRNVRRTSLLPPEAHQPVLDLLVGEDGEDLEGDALEIPPLAELTAAVTSLARGHRRKALLPLGGTPTELALVRRGDDLLVSHYETGGAPEIHVLDRQVDLREVLNVCARATLESARYETDPTARQVAVRVAERAMRSTLSEDLGTLHPTLRRGGAIEAPGEETPLAFGFHARIFPGTAPAPDTSARADVHALLFDGELWAWVRGHHVPLVRGPIMLAVQRMVETVRTVVEAAASGRPVNVRHGAGGFQYGVRLDASGRASMSLGTGDDAVAASALDVAQVTLPVLRLTSDLLRALVAVDRGQSRNLRVRSLREEVRGLRRAVRQRDTSQGFENDDTDRLRIAAALTDNELTPSPASRAPVPSLRFGERWRIAIDGLDASSTFFCGDRMVLATPRHMVAVDRDRGEVIWAREGNGGTTLMAGRVLLRLSPEGDVELCDVEDGESYAVARIAPRVSGPACGLLTSGGALPPVAVLAEAAHRLVGLDLRTGEPRWRFTSRSGGSFRLERSGRVLLVTCGDGAVHALDVVTGEDLWRFSERVRFAQAPTVCGETVVAVAGEPNSQRGAAFGIDLFSGRNLWRTELGAGVTAPPVSAGRMALVATNDTLVHALDAATGELRWKAPDPGLGAGAAALVVDEMLVTNAPAGELRCTELASGSTRWSRTLADPVADDVPRRLEPVLRGGALFVPAASVHVVRPTDGTDLAAHMPCDLVPDLLRVDERGWVYVAEESGHVAAYAPVAHLRLVRGGA